MAQIVARLLHTVPHTQLISSPTNACLYVYKYVLQNDSTAMLAVKMSAGVTPEVDLRNPLQAGDKACKWGFHPGFEIYGRHHQKSKTGVTVDPQKELMSSKNLKRKEEVVLPRNMRFQRNVTRCPDSTSHTNTQIDHLHRLQLQADDIIDYRVQ